MIEAIIRKAVSGEEATLHEVHMRSIREVCVRDHGEEEIRGWGHRPLGNRWIEAIKNDHVWVIEYNQKIYGVSFLKISTSESEKIAFLHALYLLPEALGHGLGKKLANKLIDIAKENHVDVVKLESTITAFSFYKSLGFLQTDEKQMVDIGGYPVTSFPMELRFL